MGGLQVQCRVNWPGFSMDVDLSLPAQGISVLFGSSGCGKTTLLRTIAGLQPEVSARVALRGEVWQDEHTALAPHRRPIGYVFQEASLFPHLSVMGNLLYGRKRTGRAPQVDLDHLIDLLGIAHLLERKPDRLSGGERQRVGIARALAVSPQLLLMDEPLAALDLKRKQEILPYLEKLHRELAIPVVYVTHSPDEVARLADHLVVLEQGRVVASGPLSEISHRVDFPVSLLDDVGVVIDATVASIDQQWQLAEVVFDGGSLWTADAALAKGCRLRVRIRASDVSIASEKPVASTIQNVLPGIVDRVAEAGIPGLMLVRVQVGATALLAKVTARSVHQLGLASGKPVWAQVKSVALLR